MLLLPTPTAPGSAQHIQGPHGAMMPDTLAVSRGLTGSAARWPCYSGQTRRVTRNLFKLAGFTQAAGASLAAECCRYVHFTRHWSEFQMFLVGQNSLCCRYFQRNVLKWSYYCSTEDATSGPGPLLREML